MAASPKSTSNAPPMGVRRSSTLPSSLQHSVDRQNQSPKEVEQQTIETLYAHSNARIVHFTTGKAVGVGASPRQSGFPAQKYQDVPGNLPWRSQSERTLAAGSFRIYRVPGSVAFLNAGASFLKPVLAKSQCWCVDGEGTFVLKRGPHDFYRIEIPHESEDDKTVANDFRLALDHILLFEKTPCPFQRDFDIDLPDSPSVTYVPWKPKHRPISPIRRQSLDNLLGAGPDNGLRRRSLSRTSRSVSRTSSQSSERRFDNTSVERRPVTSYTPATIQGKPVKPTIGKFEVLDRMHQRDQLVPRGRPQSASTSNDRNTSEPRAPADFDSAAPLDIGRRRSPQKLAAARIPRASRNVTAPAIVTIESINKSSFQGNDVQPSARDVSTDDRQTSVAPSAIAKHQTDTPIANDRESREYRRVLIKDLGASNQHSVSSFMPNGNGEVQSDVAPDPDQNDTEVSVIASKEPAAIDLFEKETEVPEIVASEGTPAAGPFGNEAQGSESIAAESPPAIKPGEGKAENMQTVASEVPPAIDLPEKEAGAAPLQSPLASLPDFGVDTTDDEPISRASSERAEQQFSHEQAKESVNQRGGPRIAILPLSTAAEDLQLPDTPVWHSAADLIASSSDESQHSASTVSSFVTAPTFTPPQTSAQTPGPLSTAATHSSTGSQSLMLQEEQRHRSRSPLTLTRNLYVPRQDSYEHIGAVIGEKMTGMLIGPPLQLAALMLRIASQFTNGARIEEHGGHGWARRGEKGRRLPGTWESYSEDEGDVGSEWEDDYGISIYGLETRRKTATQAQPPDNE